MLLKKAFERGLTFQIKSCDGEDRVTWGLIPHKTTWDGGKARYGPALTKLPGVEGFFCNWRRTMGSSSTNPGVGHSSRLPQWQPWCLPLFQLTGQLWCGTLQPLPVPHLCVPHGQGFWPCSRTAFPAFPVTGLCWQHWAQAVPAGSSSAQGAGIPPSPLLKGWGKNEVLLPSVVSGPSAGFTPCLSVPHRNSYPDAQYLHEVCTVLKKLGIA